MTTNINTNEESFVIEPFSYEPAVGAVAGRFVDMRWNTQPGKNNTPRKDLELVAELAEKDPNGQPIQVVETFNMLPSGRGRSEFKKQMSSWRGAPLTAVQLASLKKSTVVGLPVILNYTKDHLGHVVFEKFTPANSPEAAKA